MKIFADSNLVYLDQTFARHGDIVRIPGRNIKANQVRGADVLLVRSISQVNQALLAGSGIKFVGTATIGTDHLDTDWLDENGIRWASAPGCNADAASQYTLAMILLACERLERDPKKQTVGIIGHGNVGSRLRHLLDALGIPSVACDPPLKDRGWPGLVSMDEALAQDIVSLHVPLTRDGPCPTFQMINKLTINQMHQGALLVNSSRGDVTHGGALLVALHSGQLQAALDVWPGEPAIDTALVQASVVASPHVAGYSVQGKQSGTLQIYESFCEWQGIETSPVVTAPSERQTGSDYDPDQLAHLIIHSCEVARDDSDIRRLAGLPPGDVAAGFDQLRKTYRLRHDVPL